MSKIAPLIKQAFGTGNAHEAASFLSSAINRMKTWDKPAITKEVEAALQGVNFGRTAEAPKAAKTKIVYQDTPETVRRLTSYIRQIEDIKRELEALKANRADPAEIKRLTARIDSLTKEAVARERQHLEELAIARTANQGAAAELTADNARLLQQVEDLTKRIERLKAAMAEIANGSDADAVQLQEAERKLAATLFDLAEAQRDLKNARGEREEIHTDFMRCRAALTNTENMLEKATTLCEDLTKKGQQLRFQIDQQAAQHTEELKEERNKRLATGRRADDAERLTTQTRSKLKFEEYNGQQLTQERDRLRRQITELEAAAAKHEDDARHNYYECESLNAKLALAQKELAESHKKQQNIFGVFHRSSAYVAMALSGMCVGIGILNNQVLTDGALQAAAFILVIGYFTTRYLTKDM